MNIFCQLFAPDSYEWILQVVHRMRLLRVAQRFHAPPTPQINVCTYVEDMCVHKLRATDEKSQKKTHRRLQFHLLQHEAMIGIS